MHTTQEFAELYNDLGPEERSHLMRCAVALAAHRAGQVTAGQKALLKEMRADVAAYRRQQKREAKHAPTHGRKRAPAAQSMAGRVRRTERSRARAAVSTTAGQAG